MSVLEFNPLSHSDFAGIDNTWEFDDVFRILDDSTHFTHFFAGNILALSLTFLGATYRTAC